MIVTPWIEDIKSALENLRGIASSYDALYEEVRRIRTDPLPDSWKDIIRRTIQDHSSDSDGYKGGEDLFYSVKGLGSGIWGLRSALVASPKAIDISEPASPGRVAQETYRILRDTELVRKLKKLHANKCQICGEAIQLRNRETYSEGHHIRPLGRPHNGPDVAGNIVVLCPNHHVMCDYGAIRLNRTELHIVHGHRVDDAYISYHNNEIYGKEF